jgi:hypothetical protein
MVNKYALMAPKVGMSFDCEEKRLMRCTTDMLDLLGSVLESTGQSAASQMIV